MMNSEPEWNIASKQVTGKMQEVQRRKWCEGLQKTNKGENIPFKFNKTYLNSNYKNVIIIL